MLRSRCSRRQDAAVSHWFEGIAEHLGSAYLRYSFTYGTAQECAFLVDALGLVPGERVLDVGCGPGRHAVTLVAAGLHVHGVDISQTFIDLARAAAPANATFDRVDARTMGFVDEFDAAISLCQGAFGLAGLPGVVSPLDPDGEILTRMAAAVRPGGRVAVSAFSAYFMLRHLEAHDSFDAAAGVNHERTEIRNPAGERTDVDLWTSCFTPRELRLMAAAAGLVDVQVWSVTPGEYAQQAPSLETPEFLLVGRVPGRARAVV
jgi:SAM-dependent methyltransferase